MARKTGDIVWFCGGDTRPDKRDECPNPLHDWPLPSGYCDAADMASSRLAHKWANVKCPECGIYGWRQGEMHGLAAESVRIRREEPKDG